MELFRALGAFIEPPHAGTTALADALELGAAPASEDYTDLFVLQLYPYASVYLGAEGMLGGEARDRVAGFWRVIGLMPPAEPDHLSVMLALYASLAEVEEREDEASGRRGIRAARRAYLWEHLASWMFPFASKLSEIATGSYRRWGELLVATLSEEIAILGRQPSLPLHLREAPPLSDARATGAADFIASLLTPVRSGIILLRADLTRAGHAVDAGTRLGERAFTLRGLLAQNATGTLGWLALEAARWAAFHEQTEPLLGEVGAFWADRARRTAELLDELANDGDRITDKSL